MCFMCSKSLVVTAPMQQTSFYRGNLMGIGGGGGVVESGKAKHCKAEGLET